MDTRRPPARPAVRRGPPVPYGRQPPAPSHNPWALPALVAAIASLALPITVVATLIDLKFLVGPLHEQLLERVAAGPWLFFACAAAIALAAVTLATLALRHPAARSRHAVGKTPALIALVVGVLAVLTAPFAFVIVVPSVLKANDSMALRDVRDIGGSETIFAEYNGGEYGTLECLGAPARCLRGEFHMIPVPTDRLVERRYGHRRTLLLGAKTFAYVSVPERPGLTGFKGYCTDHTEVMCVLLKPEVPPLENGACPRSACARELLY